jgi:myo-inositol catabolism protein IolC
MKSDAQQQERQPHMITLSIDDAAQQFGYLRDRLTQGSHIEAATLTEEGKPVLAVMPWDHYETIVSLMQDPQVLLVVSPALRSHVLNIAAQQAETLYNTDPELLCFEAFGHDDIFDGTE